MDGRRIEVFANIGSAADADLAVANGAEGVGLLRTEFLYLGRTEPPTEDEQVEALTEIAPRLKGRPLIVRTLDAGADKPLPFIATEPEDNPFLGMRGLRLSLAHPELFQTQLRAILRVAKVYPVSVMFPMVSTVDEVLAARELLKGGARLDIEVGRDDRGPGRRAPGRSARPTPGLLLDRHQRPGRSTRWRPSAAIPRSPPCSRRPRSRCSH